MGKGDGEVKSAEQLIQAVLLVGAVQAKSHGPAFERLDGCV